MKRYLIWIFILTILIAWQIDAQMNAPRDKGDSAGLKARVEELEAKVASLEQREALLTTGQLGIYQLKRLAMACRIIQAGNESDAWGVYLFDENSSTGNKFTLKPVYVPLAVQDESDMAAHITALESE